MIILLYLFLIFKCPISVPGSIWENQRYNLIDTLNNYSDSVNKVLNVDRTLWMHALNYTLINFDSYIGYAQNYYLYKDKTGQFNPLLWDLNMSFGSFSLTDASSIYFSGFDILEAQNMDPLLHHTQISVSPRPLLRNLFFLFLLFQFAWTENQSI